MFVATPASIPELRQTKANVTRRDVHFIPAGSLGDLSVNESGSWIEALEFLLGSWATEKMPAHYVENPRFVYAYGGTMEHQQEQMRSGESILSLYEVVYLGQEAWKRSQKRLFPGRARTNAVFAYSGGSAMARSVPVPQLVTVQFDLKGRVHFDRSSPFEQCRKLGIYVGTRRSL